MNISIYQTKSKQLFNRHFEWAALATGVLVMALMNPYIDSGQSWCLFERIGISFCPGEGLAHSIAFIFRGDFANAVQANILGPFALIVLLSRVCHLIRQNLYLKPSN